MKENIKQYNLPKDGEVQNSDWKDDIDYETFGTNEQEMEYISPDKVSESSIEKIKNIDLRPKLKDRGSKIASVFNSEKLLA